MGTLLTLLRRRVAADTTAPTLLSTTVAIDGLTVTLVFSEAATAEGYPQLAIAVDGVPWSTIRSQSGNGTATWVAVSNDLEVTPIAAGRAVTLSFTDDAGGNRVRDAAGNHLANLTDFPCVNNSGQ